MSIKYDEKSCGLVLFRMEGGKRKYLLLHYPRGHWDLVKGHIEESDKSEHETAKREMQEETGIKDLKILDNYREAISYKYMNKGKLSNKQVVFFLGETEELDVKVSHEHQNFIWLGYPEAEQKLTFENAKQLIRKSEEYFKV